MVSKMEEELAKYLENVIEEESFLKGEEQSPFAPSGTQLPYGESGEDGWQYGGGEQNVFPSEKKTTVDLELQREQERKAQLCEKFYQINSERQEVRRKNVFLQKKLVEFFKKRKMDHVLKEDPKGLDQENKYLKRLHELQVCKSTLEEERSSINEKITNLSTKASEIKADAEKELTDYIELQRKTAGVLKLKAKKKISIKAVGNFLEVQKGNASELSRLRLKEIKMKKQLTQNQDVLKGLESIGHDLRRADYEQLMFEYQMEFKKYEEKVEETEKIKTKARTVAQKLSQAQHRATKLDKEVSDWKTHLAELNDQAIEIKDRLHRLELMRDNLKTEEKKLCKSSGLVTRIDLLSDFERSLKEEENVRKRLQREEIIYSSRENRGKGGQVNTPIDFLQIEFDVGGKLEGVGEEGHQ